MYKQRFTKLKAFSKEECKRLIDEIKRTLRPSTIASAGEYDPTYRTSSTCDLGYKNTSLIKAIDKKICDFIGIDSSLEKHSRTALFRRARI